MIKPDSIVISEKDLLELMQRAFDEGYKGYQESRDSVVVALVDEWRTVTKPSLNAESKWAIAKAATDEVSLRHLQGRRRNALSAAQQDLVDEINQELDQSLTVMDREFISAANNWTVAQELDAEIIEMGNDFHRKFNHRDVLNAVTDWTVVSTTGQPNANEDVFLPGSYLYPPHKPVFKSPILVDPSNFGH